MTRLIALPLSLFIASAAMAQTAGHPAAGHGSANHPATGNPGNFRLTPDMLAPKTAPNAADLPHEGKVVSTISASGYSYVEVTTGKGIQWIAGPATPMKAGDTIRFSDGPVMANFTSKSLQRTFPTITFVDHVAVVGQ